MQRRLGDKVWECQDSLSSEVETQEFLYGLVRLLKPAVVVETGCYHGEASLVIASALRMNGHGHLYTCDILSRMAIETAEKLSGYPATVVCMDACEMLMGIQNVDLAFIDGSAERTKEMLALNNPRFVVLHDAANPDYRTPTHWKRIDIPCPLGVALCACQ